MSCSLSILPDPAHVHLLHLSAEARSLTATIRNDGSTRVLSSLWPILSTRPFALYTASCRPAVAWRGSEAGTVYAQILLRQPRLWAPDLYRTPSAGPANRCKTASRQHPEMLQGNMHWRPRECLDNRLPASWGCIAIPWSAPSGCPPVLSAHIIHAGRRCWIPTNPICTSDGHKGVTMPAVCGARLWRYPGRFRPSRLRPHRLLSGLDGQHRLV